MQHESEKNIASPCIDKCCLNEDDICMGCFRSLEEILLWGNANSQQRLEMLQLAKARRQVNK